jgi:hypothetical protein
MLRIPRQIPNFSFLDKSEILKLKMKATGQYEHARMDKRYRFIRYVAIGKFCGNPLMVAGGK